MYENSQWRIYNSSRSQSNLADINPINFLKYTCLSVPKRQTTLEDKGLLPGWGALGWNAKIGLKFRQVSRVMISAALTLCYASGAPNPQYTRPSTSVLIISCRHQSFGRSSALFAANPEVAISVDSLLKHDGQMLDWCLGIFASQSDFMKSALPAWP